MAAWTKILPYFFIEWYSKRYCEVIYIPKYNTTVVSPFKDVFIKYEGIEGQK